jgi:uncharacterized membrane protein (DUF373 family)
MRKYWNRPLGSKLILILSLVLLALFIVVPWQRPCQVRNDPNAPLICGRTFAWEGSDVGLYAMGLVVLILVWELLPVFIPRLSMRGWLTAIVTAALSALLVLFTLIKLIKDYEFQTGWAWISLAIAILVVAVMRRPLPLDAPTRSARAGAQGRSAAASGEAPPAGGSST